LAALIARQASTGQAYYQEVRRDDPGVARVKPMLERSPALNARLAPWSFR
jgi:hypothetical protein